MFKIWYGEGNALTDNSVINSTFNGIVNHRFNFDLELKDDEKIIKIDTYLLYIILQNKKEFNGARDNDIFLKIFIKNFDQNMSFQKNLSKVELIINDDDILYKELLTIHKKIKELFNIIYNEYLIKTIQFKDHV